MTFSETKIFTTSIFVSIIIIDISGNLVDTLNNQILLFFLPIIWPGLAHGSLDLDIAINRGIVKKFKDKIIFLIFYFSLIVIFFIFWLSFPNLTFLLFLILSIIHFGISDSIETKKNTKFAEILIRGSVVLVLPLKFHQDETIEIFKLFNLEEIMLLNLLIINEYFFYMIIIALLAWVLIHRSFIKINKQVLTEYVLIGFCLIYFQPLISFLIYFCFLHSVRHLNSERKELDLSFKVLFKKTIPFTFLAILALIIFFSLINLNEKDNLYYFLVGLASLTIPHVILINHIKS